MTNTEKLEKIAMYREFLKAQGNEIAISTHFDENEKKRILKMLEAEEKKAFRKVRTTVSRIEIDRRNGEGIEAHKHLDPKLIDDAVKNYEPGN